jgi:hypothetical protein
MDTPTLLAIFIVSGVGVPLMLKYIRRWHLAVDGHTITIERQMPVVIVRIDGSLRWLSRKAERRIMSKHIVLSGMLGDKTLRIELDEREGTTYCSAWVDGRQRFRDIAGTKGDVEQTVVEAST